MSAHTKVSVLFVDDEAAILDVVRCSLKDSSYEVLTACNGAEALKVLRNRNVDVLVSDIDMPELSGLELMRIARREFPKTIRMLLTGAATMDSTVTAINEGEVLRFFMKPFDVMRFRDAMLGVVDRIRELRRESAQEARKARRDALCSRVEGQFPGTTKVPRNADGEVVVDIHKLDHELASTHASVRELLRKTH